MLASRCWHHVGGMLRPWPEGLNMVPTWPLHDREVQACCAGIMSEGAEALTCRPQHGPDMHSTCPRTPASDGGSPLSDVGAST